MDATSQQQPLNLPRQLSCNNDSGSDAGSIILKPDSTTTDSHHGHWLRLELVSLDEDVTSLLAPTTGAAVITNPLLEGW